MDKNENSPRGQWYDVDKLIAGFRNDNKSIIIELNEYVHLETKRKLLYLKGKLKMDIDTFAELIFNKEKREKFLEDNKELLENEK